MSAELSVRSPMPLRALSRLAKSNDAFAILPAGKTRKKTRQKMRPRGARQRFGRRRYDARLRHRLQPNRCRTLTRLRLPVSLPVISYASLSEISAGPSSGTTDLLGPPPGELGSSKERSPGRGRSGALVQRCHHDSG